MGYPPPPSLSLCLSGQTLAGLYRRVIITSMCVCVGVVAILGISEVTNFQKTIVPAWICLYIASIASQSAQWRRLGQLLHTYFAGMAIFPRSTNMYVQTLASFLETIGGKQSLHSVWQIIAHPPLQSLHSVWQIIAHPPLQSLHSVWQIIAHPQLFSLQTSFGQPQRTL